MILEMDKGVEQVRAKLVELGLEKNTLFLFFSDNGDAPRTATGSPRFRGHKGSVYEGGTRVPRRRMVAGENQARHQHQRDEHYPGRDAHHLVRCRNRTAQKPSA